MKSSLKISWKWASGVFLDESRETSKALPSPVIERLETRTFLSGGQLWVAPNGTGNSFSQASPGPLGNLFSFLDTQPKSPSSPITVNFDNGSYPVTSTLHIDANDSNIILQAAPVATPVLSGGASITGWQSSGSVGQYSIYSAPVPSGLGQFRDLYVDGVRAVRARTPDRSYGTLNWVLVNGQPNGQALIPRSVAPNLVSYQNILSSTNPIEAVVFQSYTQSRLQITNVATRGSYYLLTFNKSTELSDLLSLKRLGRTFATNRKFYLENMREGLNVPGEWYEDVAGQRVYYIPRAGELGPTGISAIVPRLLSSPQSLVIPGHSVAEGTPILEIGTPGTALGPSNVTIRGLSFEYSSWLGASLNGYVGIQEGIFERGGTAGLLSYSTQIASVAIVNANNIELSGDNFEHLGGAGVSLVSGSRSNVIESSTFSDISGNGVIVDELPGIAGLIASQASLDDIVTANFIHDVGVEYFDSAGILAAVCQSLNITHNTIYDLPGNGIADGRVHNGDGGTGNWTAVGDNGIGTWSVCDIAYNYVHNVDRLLPDGAAIYIDGCNWDSMTGIGTTVQSNTISMVGNYDNGVYLDQNTNGAEVDNNRISRVGAHVVFNNAQAYRPYFVLLTRSLDRADGLHNQAYNNGPNVNP